MKKLLFVLFISLAMLAIPLAAFGGQFELGFEWDCNTEEICSGYRLLKSDTRGPPYVDVKEVEGKDTCEVYHVFETPNGVETIQYFVVIALASDGRESGYSNEVNFTFDFRVMDPANTLTGELQGDDILFQWAQPAIERVKTWGLYRSETSGGPYDKILDIAYTGQTGPQFSETVNMPVPDGEIKTYYFVLVTVSDQGVSSVDSNQVTVVIDKRVIGPVYNFKIKVKAE